MNNKPNTPDELIMFDRQFSWWVTWSTNRWLVAAFLISIVCDVLLHDEVRQWSVFQRVALVFAEFLAVGLGIIDLTRWVQGMDELQRRITLAALFFSVSATLIFIMLWLRLDRAGFFHAVFGPPFMNNTWGIYSVAHAYMLLGGYYGLGYLIFKRRYK